MQQASGNQRKPASAGLGRTGMTGGSGKWSVGETYWWTESGCRGPRLGCVGERPCLRLLQRQALGQCTAEVGRWGGSDGIKKRSCVSGASVLIPWPSLGCPSCSGRTDFFLFLTHADLILTSGPLHLLFLLPRRFFSSIKWA